MATAVLENNNPYAKFGLRRRPTYDELIGLINENASLFGPNPDRRASAFKASPEGSFFDGLNYTDKLKEEQERILNKQMRDVLFRQNVGNQTIAIAQLQQDNQTPTASQTQTLPTGNIAGAGIDAQLEQVRQRQETRRQQTGETHRGILGGGLDTIASRRFSLTPLGSGAPTPLAQPIPQSFSISSESEPELMTDREMQTARGEMPTNETILNSLKFRHPEATEAQMQNAVNILGQYKDFTPEQIATDFSSFGTLNNIYDTLARNGFISKEVAREYREITGEISIERGGRKRAPLLRKLAEHYRENIYDKYISDIANRPVGV